MTANKKLIGLFLSAIAAVTFLAVAYFIGVPLIVDGEYPGKTRATRFFYQHQHGLESLFRQLKVDGHARILCYPDKVFLGPEPKEPPQPITGDSLDVYLGLCRDAQATQGWAVDNGFLFYFGGAGNDENGFDIAFVRRDGAPSEMPDCEQVEPLGDWGRCQFELDPPWFLDYEWLSREFVESWSEDVE